LQNQERTNFGPVNIRRMTIQLSNDKGFALDLNGANWSFSLIAEQLYNPSRKHTNIEIKLYVNTTKFKQIFSKMSVIGQNRENFNTKQ
jgi:hypothetical protein